MQIRKADSQDMDEIYDRGFDVWSEGATREEYLDGCRTSPKYKKGQWFVLANGNDLLSSLIIYNFGDQKFGIGSIATPTHLRKKGYATKLISSVIAEIENSNSNPTIFLYSDVDAAFYEKFGFLRLQPDGQRYQTTTCMVRAKGPKPLLGDKDGSPPYF